MTTRLARIQVLILAITTVTTIVAMAIGHVRPLGVVLGGGAVWLDFVAIRGLASYMVARRSKLQGVVSLAIAKSAVLLAVPGIALFLPGTLVDGASFALGVTALPVAIVLDACIPVVGDAREGEV
jgi:hypothetical protein